MNWKFWKKKMPKCFGTQSHTCTPIALYMEQKCSSCEHAMPCFVKSLPAYTIKLGIEDLSQYL